MPSYFDPSLQGRAGHHRMCDLPGCQGKCFDVYEDEDDICEEQSEKQMGIKNGSTIEEALDALFVLTAFVAIIGFMVAANM